MRPYTANTKKPKICASKRAMTYIIINGIVFCGAFYVWRFVFGGLSRLKKNILLRWKKNMGIAGVLALFGLFAFVFSGCSGNFVQMQYSSAKEHNYLFNQNAPTIIAYKKGDLLAASYVPFVMESLAKMGFTALYTQEQLPRKKARNIVFISLAKLTTTTPTSSVSYMPSKMIDQSSCINYDGIYYCREETYPIITDYTTSLEVSSGYHFVMDWYDLPTKKRIFYIDGSIEDSPCIFEGIYKDLIYQTISRMDISRGELYSYPTTLSYYDASCLLAQTKKLGVKR